MAGVVLILESILPEAITTWATKILSAIHQLSKPLRTSSKASSKKAEDFLPNP